MSIEQFFPETKLWVRGPFLDFYRQYGLDICGYPITDEFMDHGMRMQYFQRVALEEYEEGKIRLRLAAQHALEAGQRIDVLEQEIQLLRDRLESESGPVPQPVITDIIEQLPRDASGMFARPLPQIKYLVINHTAVKPGVDPKRIAEAHRKRWPAIVCQFYVEGDGTIFQTNPMNEVVDDKEDWLRDAINIHVAGDFTDTVPSTRQLQSLATLCAWLLDMLNLDDEAVQGASRFTKTQSPGKQWSEGERWRDQLIKQIVALRELGAALPVDNSAEIERLRAQISALEQERDALASMLEEAQGQITTLIERVALLEEALRGDSNQEIQQPPITDFITELPRDDDKMIDRQPGDIRYIVINHTAVPADVPVKRVAKAHRARWPAIVCHYFIEGDGTILQTNPITQVVDDKQAWLLYGVNIHVAGNFSDQIPNNQQLTSLAKLVAWLMISHDLPIDSLRGVKEFIVTQSPGRQWLQGQRWKDVLVERVRSLLYRGPALPPDSGTDEALLASLRETISLLQKDKLIMSDQIDSLQEAKQALERERERLNATISEQQRIIQALQDQQPMPEDALLPISISSPPMVELVDSLPRHPTNRYSHRSLGEITHLAIHHSAAPSNITAQRIAEYHVTSESHQWPGIGYHYYITPDGTINHTQDLELASYHVYRNNQYTIGICVAGNFTKVIPTPAQIDATGHLAAWLMQEFNIPLDHVLGHKDYPYNATSCPGKQWQSENKWRDLLFASIQSARQNLVDSSDKAIFHYLLFWQQPELWAQEDWLGAVNYIGRFRPTAGFSVDDAKTAERVTIIGGIAGVNQEAEDILRAAGCNVERIAGKDFAETKAMLDRMAESGQRFLNT